jgi:hypothetical protein
MSIEAKRAVARLQSDLQVKASEMLFEVGALTDFGQGLAIYDPQSGEQIVAARPAIRRHGQSGILLTCEQVMQEIEGARRTRLAMDRLQ